jgi:IS5 family transposase
VRRGCASAFKIDTGAPSEQQRPPSSHWVKKNNQAYFGNQGHTVVDSQDGCVEYVRAHPTNAAGIDKLPKIIRQWALGVQAVLADKGYASAASRQWLKSRHRQSNPAQGQQRAFGTFVAYF